MKKREFNALPIFVILLITAILGGIITRVLGNDSSIVNFLVTIVGLIANFAICRGLIVDRKGNIESYFMQVKELNLKIFLVNLVYVIILFLISLVSVGSIVPIYMQAENLQQSATSLIAGSLGIFGLYIILHILLSLFTAYMNFVAADPRNEDMPLMELIKKVFSTGVSLIGKTLISILKYMLLPMIIFFALLGFFVMSLFSNDGSVGVLIATGLFIIIAVFVFIYLLIKYTAELSDHYLNLYGDYNTDTGFYDDQEPVTFTRKVDFEADNKDDFEK